MSRPIRQFLPAALAVISLGFTACVGTVYDRMYSNKQTYYKPPPEKKQLSAEDILGKLDETKEPPGGLPVDSGALPPPAGDIPGLPPVMPADGAVLPPADGAMPPAVPGLPPL